MRHAQSKANAAGIIVSHIANDRQGDYGLTEHGRQQAHAAAQGCGLPGDTVIYSSEFARARETAQVMRAHLGAPEVIIAEALRERRFGQWEGSAAVNYARVWAADETDPRHADGNVESAAAVLDRATAFIAELERRHCGRDILLVSHGDTLQILQAGFSGVDPSRHRTLPHLATAEIRQLRLSQGTAGKCLASGLSVAGQGVGAAQGARHPVRAGHVADEAGGIGAGHSGGGDVQRAGRGSPQHRDGMGGGAEG